MWRNLIRVERREQGQSLVETALTMPLLLGLAFNIINFGYFWFMVITLAAAPRMAVQYSTQGGAAVGSGSAPSATAVSQVAFDNMINAVVGATNTNTAVRVCSGSVGVNADGTAMCLPFGDTSFTFSNVAADPEAPTFVLNRVDVGYTVKPLIPGTAFNLIVLSNYKFQRHVSMRSLF